MTADEAIIAAVEFLQRENTTSWTFEVRQALRDRRRTHEWNVQIQWKSPDGVQVDGPGVVIVCEQTGQARFFEG